MTNPTFLARLQAFSGTEDLGAFSSIVTEHEKSVILTSECGFSHSALSTPHH
jgi:hypothetical protein